MKSLPFLLTIPLIAMSKWGFISVIVCLMVLAAIVVAIAAWVWYPQAKRDAIKRQQEEDMTAE